MKKRLLSLVLCLVMVFSLMPLSAMAEIYPVTAGTETVIVRFKNGETSLGEQRVVKKAAGDTLEEGAIYDPGCPLGDNKIFLGWSFADQEGDVDDIVAYLNVPANWNALKGTGENDGLVVTAVVSDVHYIVYRDLNERVLKTQDVVYKTNGNSWSTTITTDYAPEDPNADFYGWATSKTANVAVYPNIGDPVDLSETTELTLYPVIKAGGWIEFIENDQWEKDGKSYDIHASYQPPVFVEQGGEAVDLSGPEYQYKVSAKGWHFDGWYRNADGTGDKVESVSYSDLDSTTKKLTVYAKWSPETVDYKVAYWQQNANDDGYSLKEVLPGTGTAGELATFDQNKSYEHFHRNDTKTNEAKELVTIAGDGTTIRNVYFDRDVFTLKFGSNFNYASTGKYFFRVQEPFYLYTGPYHGTPSLATEVAFAPGAYDVSTFQNLYYYKDRFIASNRLENCIDGNTLYYNYRGFNQTYYPYNYTNSVSRIEERTSSGGTITKEITAKFGEDISRYFPINGDTRGATWEPMYSRTYGYILVFVGTMPAENVTFEKNDSGSSNPKHIEFYVEPNPVDNGQAAVNSFNENNVNTYVKYGNTIPANYSFFTEDEDFIDLTGYDKHSSDPEFDSDGRTYNSSSSYTLKLYYTRHESKLYFVPGDASDWQETAKYKDPLASHEPGSYVIGSTIGEIEGKNKVFEGWYDNRDYAGEPFDFSKTMPAVESITLYAKWKEIEHQVVLNANGGKFSGDKDFITFTLEDGGKIERNDPTRIDENGAVYTFVGWYTDEALTHRFSLDTKITSDLEDLKDYAENIVDEETGAMKYVRGQLTLYAKWRQVMASDEYIKVVYEPDGYAQDGTTEISGTLAKDEDPLHYADAAEAIAQPAAVSSEAQFVEWEVLDANGDPTGVTVKPGKVFTVQKGNATGPVEEADENNAEVTYKVYTVTLRAKYNLVETTHITWFGNGGTTEDGDTAVTLDNVSMNSTKDILSEETFSKENSVFLGWAKLNETDAQGNPNPDVVDGDSYKVKELTEADVWLKWDGTNWKVDGSTVALGVAADEIKPYNVLYAVWEQAAPSTILIDYNVPVKLTENLTAAKEIAINNENAAFENGTENGHSGVYTKADTTLSYKLDDVVINPKTGANALDAETHKSTASTDTYDVTIRAFDGVDKALFHDGSWKSVTTVPATSVYYSDKQADVTLDKNGDGFNAGIVTDAERFDSDTKGKQVYYTFTGTGIDVYSTTDPNMKGQILAQLFDKDGNKVDSLSMKNYSPAERHNVPTIFFHDKPYGEYTLRLYVAKGLNYRIDGIRVYNPAGFGEGHQDAQAEKAYAEYSEQNAAFTNLRDLLLTNPTNVGVTGGVGIFSDTKLAEGQTQKTVTVPVLNDDGTQKVDQDGKLVTEEVAYQPHTLKAYEIDGPKNEVYLDAGDAIAFTITNWATYKDKGVKLMMGVHKLKDDATFSVNSGNDQDAPEVDQYYDVTPADGSNKVMVANTSEMEGVLISVTNIKVSGGDTELAVKASGDLGAKTLAVTDEAEENALFVAVDEEAITYASEFNGRRIKAAVEAQMVVPETPDEPEVPQQPTIQDIIRDLLSSFVNALFGSISRLFGH